MLMCFTNEVLNVDPAAFDTSRYVSVHPTRKSADTKLSKHICKCSACTYCFFRSIDSVYLITPTVLLYRYLTTSTSSG